MTIPFTFTIVSRNIMSYYVTKSKKMTIKPRRKVPAFLALADFPIE